MYLRIKSAAMPIAGSQVTLSGKMNEMHAFDLKENRLSVYEASLLRFMRIPVSFSYQDEADVYFDKRYLLFRARRELYFFRNCRWQQLKAVELPGAVTLDAPAGTLRLP